jgi:hypothetical protein
MMAGMKKRAVDLDIAELACFGQEAAAEAAAEARVRGLSSFGAAEVARPVGLELRFVTVDPNGEIMVGDRVRSAPRLCRPGRTASSSSR